MCSSPLFDSHCHFDFPQFDLRRHSLWKYCNQLGVTRLLIPGVSPEQWEVARQLCQKYSGIYMAVGLHPWWIKELSCGCMDKQQLNNLRQCLVEDWCLAVGECGLDKLISTPFNHQLEIFIQHMAIAQEFEKPLIIHARKTHNDVLKLISDFHFSAGGVIHGFSGSLELALDYWSKGFYIGVGGIITYERASKTRRAVAELPIEAIVLETDAPDMPLSGYQGEDNAPSKLVQIAKTLAQLRNENFEIIAHQTTENCLKLFQKNIRME